MAVLATLSLNKNEPPSISFRSLPKDGGRVVIKTPPCTFFSGSWRVARGLEHDAERSEAKCSKPRCVLSIAVTSGTEPTCRERPITPCGSNTWGGPVPRRTAVIDAPWGVRVFRAPVQGSAKIAVARCQRGMEWRMNANWYVGVDWASESHHVFLTDADGRKIGERVFKHGGEGLAEMAAWLLKSTGATPRRPSSRSRCRTAPWSKA